jgi:DNA-binding NtrC family response regulator
MLSWEKQRILCVDDSEDNCTLLDFILTDAGYEVESAHSVKDALQQIEHGKFNLCLVDLFLPDGTGFELSEKIHAIDPLMSIFLCSGDGRDYVEQQAIQAGIQAFFLKPIDFDLLVKTINKLLKLSQVKYSNMLVKATTE